MDHIIDSISLCLIEQIKLIALFNNQALMYLPCIESGVQVAVESSLTAKCTNVMEVIKVHTLN